MDHLYPNLQVGSTRRSHTWIRTGLSAGSPAKQVNTADHPYVLAVTSRLSHDMMQDIPSCPPLGSVPARANIATMKSIGIRAIIAFSAVGSLPEQTDVFLSTSEGTTYVTVRTLTPMSTAFTTASLAPSLTEYASVLTCPSSTASHAPSSTEYASVLT